MFNWIWLFLSKSCDYLTSPILYHVSCDGLVMNTFYKVAYFTDAYGMWFLIIVFAAAVCFYRNTFFHIAGLLSDFNLADRSEKIDTIFNLANALYEYLLTFYTTVVNYIKNWRK